MNEIVEAFFEITTIIVHHILEAADNGGSFQLERILDFVELLVDKHLKAKDLAYHILNTKAV